MKLDLKTPITGYLDSCNFIAAITKACEKMDEPMTSRDLIRKAVADAGLNHRELSEETGGKVTLQTIWRYLRGESDITTEKLDHLLRALKLEWPKRKDRK